MNKIVWTLSLSALSLSAQAVTPAREIPILSNRDSSTIEIEDIVVTGFQPSTQHQNTVKIEVLNLKGLDKPMTPNFAESLTHIPGVDMISKGSGVAKPVIRGMSMNDILVLNNGFRKENYQYSSHHPLGIDEFGIEKVEVIKGPASLLYGSDAIGGVINFIPEALPTDDGLSGDYQVQLFSNSLGENSSLGLKGATGNLSGAVRLSQKSHADYLQGGGDYLGNSRFNEQSLKADLGYRIADGNFRLQYERSRENLGLVEPEALEGISERGRKPNLFYQQLNAQQLSSRNKLYLGRNQLEINGSFQQTELIHFGEPSAYELQMQLSTLSGEAKLLMPLCESALLIVGTQGMHQENQNLHDRETILLPNADINNLSGFVFADQVFSKLHVQGGVRYDYKTLNSAAVGLSSDSDFRQTLDKTYGSVSGSLGLTWHPVESWYVRSNLATGYRTPNLAELSSNGPHEGIYELGDATLSPERSLEWDLSAHLHQTNLVVDLAAFVNRVNDFIHQTPTGTDTPDGLPIYQYRQADAILYGGEADVHFHPGALPWLHLEQSVAWVVGKQDNGDFLPFIPATKLNSECRVTKKKCGKLRNVFAAINVHIALDQNHPAPDESVTPAYTLLNLSLGGTLPLRQNALEWQLGVNNLTDVCYIDHLSTLKEVGKFNPGRNAMLLVKIPF